MCEAKRECRWGELRRWLRFRLRVGQGLWSVLLDLIQGLVAQHLEVVVLMVLVSRLSEAGFRCALLGGQLVLLHGQWRCVWVINGYSHSQGEQSGGPAHSGRASLSSVHMSLVGIRVFAVLWY